MSNYKEKLVLAKYRNRLERYLYNVFISNFEITKKKLVEECSKGEKAIRFYVPRKKTKWNWGILWDYSCQGLYWDYLNTALGEICESMQEEIKKYYGPNAQIYGNWRGRSRFYIALECQQI